MQILEDDMLEDVTGGYLHLSQWVTFLTEQILPPVRDLMTGASGSDRTILSTIYDDLQGTAAPGASAADPVMNLWTAYNTTYRPSLESNTIKVTLDQVLYKANQYIVNNL